MGDAEYENIEQFPSLIRSVESTERVYLRFVNRTKTTVEILWINYSGEYVRYQLLRHKSIVDVDTFKTHPWVAVDVFTGDRMLLDQQSVYLPQTTRELVGNNPNLIYPSIPQERRKTVLITLPLYSLRERALLVVRNCFQTPDEVNSLQLPQLLSDDLKREIISRNHKLRRAVATWNQST